MPLDKETWWETTEKKLKEKRRKRLIAWRERLRDVKENIPEEYEVELSLFHEEFPDERPD